VWAIIQVSVSWTYTVSRGLEIEIWMYWLFHNPSRIYRYHSLGTK